MITIEDSAFKKIADSLLTSASRIGRARAHIQQALMMIDGRDKRPGNAGSYWAYKELARALDALEGRT